MGGIRRIAVASAVAIAIALSLVGCSGLNGAATLPNAEAAGEVVGAQAGAPTPTPTPTPTPQFSVNSGWTDTTGCPSGAFDEIKAGMAAGSTVTPATPSTSSGPTSLPSLTSKFIPSCAFTFTTTATASLGVVGRGEMFIGMGPSYDVAFTKALLAVGFRKYSASAYTTTYVRGRSAVGLEYHPAGAGGDLYSVVGVIGVN